MLRTSASSFRPLDRAASPIFVTRLGRLNRSALQRVAEWRTVGLLGEASLRRKCQRPQSVPRVNDAIAVQVSECRRPVLKIGAVCLSREQRQPGRKEEQDQRIARVDYTAAVGVTLRELRTGCWRWCDRRAA